MLVCRPANPLLSFYIDLSELLTLICAICAFVLLLGDFTIHIDTDCAAAHELLSVLKCFNLVHVDFPTHTCGHILYLLCTRGLNIVTVSGSQIGLSDHLFMKLSCEFPLSMSAVKSLVSFHNLTSINPVFFSASLQQSFTKDVMQLSCPHDIITDYNKSISKALDLHLSVDMCCPLIPPPGTHRNSVLLKLRDDTLSVFTRKLVLL